MDVTLHLPDGIAEQLDTDPGDMPRRLLESLLLEGYRAGKLSRGQVSEALQLDYWATEQFLADHHATVGYSAEDLKRDIESNRRASPR